MHNHEMTPTAYRVLTMVGHCFNGIGSVWLARHATSGNLVAVKKYDVDKCSFEVLSILQHESQAMRQLQHARLMPCLSSFVSGTELWMVEPLCGYGSTKDLLAAHFTEGLPERAIALILRDVVRALDYLHSQGYIHRSVRASHILIGGSGDTYLAGLRSSYCAYRHGRRLTRVHQFPELASDGLNWLSPEILAQDLRGYTASSDVYSLGITACELANGMEPFAQMAPAAMLHEKLAGEGEPVLLDATTIDAGYAEREQAEGEAAAAADREEGVPSSSTLSDSYLRLMRAAPGRRFSDAFHQFVRLCVDREPSRRPTAGQLLSHPFIVRQCRRAPPLSQLLRPDVPVSEATLLEGEQIMRDRLVTDMGNLQVHQDNSWDF